MKSLYSTEIHVARVLTKLTDLNYKTISLTPRLRITFADNESLVDGRRGFRPTPGPQFWC